MIKRETGDAIRSRLPRNRRLEPALEGPVTDLHRVAAPLPAGCARRDRDTPATAHPGLNSLEPPGPRAQPRRPGPPMHAVRLSGPAAPRA